MITPELRDWKGIGLRPGHSKGTEHPAVMLLPGEQGFEIQGLETQRPEVNLSGLTAEQARS